MVYTWRDVRLEFVSPIGETLAFLVHIIAFEFLRLGLDLAHVVGALVQDHAEHEIFEILVRRVRKRGHETAPTYKVRFERSNQCDIQSMNEFWILF